LYDNQGTCGQLGGGPVQGQVLDTFYIPSRYPNSHPEGAPFEHYGPLQSEEALRFAGAVIEFVRTRLA